MQAADPKPTRRAPARRRLAPRDLGPGTWRRALLLGAVAALFASTSLLYLTVAGASVAAATAGSVVTAAAVLDRVGRRAIGLCVVVISGALGLGMVDLVLRRVCARRLYYRPFEQFVRKWPTDPRLLRFVADVDERREVWGDLGAMSGDPALRERRSVWFHTDGAGFRNADLPYRPADVVLLGDSFGVGEGTSQEDTWASHLTRAGHEVVNLSMPGSPGREALTLAWESRRLHFAEDSVVVWAFFSGNDLWDDYPEWTEPLTPRAWPGQLFEAARAYRRRSPLRLLSSSGPTCDPGSVVRRELGGQPFLFFGPYAERAQLTVEQLRARQQRARMQDAMRRMRALMRAHGLRVLITVVPSKEEVYADLLGRPLPRGETAFARLVREDAEVEGFPVLDLTPRLVEARRGDRELLWWRDDTHWSPAGHRVAAAAVLEHLAGLSAVVTRAE